MLPPTIGLSRPRENQASRQAITGKGLNLGGFVPGNQRAHPLKLRGGCTPPFQQNESCGLNLGRRIKGALTGAAHGLRQRGACRQGMCAEFEAAKGGD